MNSGYEGSLPGALGKKIVNINFFILIIGFFIIAILYHLRWPLYRHLL